MKFYTDIEMNHAIKLALSQGRARSMNNYYSRMVLHVARLAKKPGWTAYTKAFAEGLESEHPEIYGGLTKDVRELLKSNEEKKRRK